ESSRSGALLELEAARSGEILTFTRNVKGIKGIKGRWPSCPINRDSEEVMSAVYVPLRSFSKDFSGNWVLSFEFATPKNWTDDEIEVILHVSRKLSAILSNSAGPLFFPPEEILKGLVAFTVRETEAEWGQLNVRHRFLGEAVTVLGEVRPVE